MATRLGVRGGLLRVCAAALQGGRSNAKHVTRTTNRAGMVMTMNSGRHVRSLATGGGGPATKPAVKVGVILERYPLSEPALTPFEKKFQEFSRQMDEEKSAVSFEEYLQMLVEQEGGSKKKKKSKKSNQKQEQGEEQDSSAATATEQAAVDASDTAPVEFEPAPLETEDDRAHNTKSLNRCLSSKLYLLIKTKQSDVWHFPQLPLTNEESIRACAENAMATVNGDTTGDFETYFIGNAPCYHTVNKSSNDAPDEYTFYLRCMLVQGAYAPTADVTDYAWVPETELQDYIDNADKFKHCLFG
ncbi:hypothetical protein PTSG_13142 [Salpingoeca rosetta]|uniref:Large ribosomal subunit protein mL46 n=1 Tax=Salpingoeca rosetta (strain ATCC 50818 / BSB-021) TaxID=946362 RepID=F2US65_SALR5|nr:uncharacterized protein PTSG_13142 [Salpingoeca rosetta]EGD80470.1 hypothetical protein PTSG_13142 [Salpingoeca rosetta]|eukprot:XP_004988034.1 hypothetical protein PTSG_13142 [Salpingoeca rosetta]